MTAFADRLLAWFDTHGRHDLPWQRDVTPYRVWVSEIMLQQTQVATVIPFFERFMRRFPDVGALAAAPIDEVLHHWSGLGYYARARNLHRAAVIVDRERGGAFPRDIEALTALPGIGRSTAGAILALAFGDRQPILDGNVKRVLARYHEIAGWPGQARVANALWSVADAHTPDVRVADYTQAIMDLGATLCTRAAPACERCPVHADCGARRHGTQAQYPGRKPRRALPRKTTRFVMAIRTDGARLLARRPPSGVWGGLWSFPELAPDEPVDAWCRALGLAPRGDVVTHPPLVHTFTHFQLTIVPLEIAVDDGRCVMDSDRWLWYHGAAPARVGLAKPVAELLGNPRSRGND